MKKLFYILILFLSNSLFAQDINIIVPFPAGGAYDIVARKFARFVTEETKIPVVVTNVLGAGGYIGLQKLETSSPNTLIITSNAIYNHLIERQIPLENFKFISILADGPYFLTVSKTSGLTCERLKKDSRTFFASTGGKDSGSSVPVSFIQEKYPNFEDVPYKGVVNSLPDLLAGRIDLTFVSGFFNARPELIYLANSSDKPFDSIPTMKTCLGVEKTITASYIMAAKHNMDTNLIKQLNQLSIQFIEKQETIEYYKNQGLTSKIGNLEYTDKLVKLEYKKIKLLIQ
jgi:tripartite-type tricarboxylate transporter receptor subunit TctC